MKIIFIFLSVFLFPLSAFADLEFFLSPQEEPYDASAWSSNVFPDDSSDFIGIEFHPSVTPLPNEYFVVDTVVQELFHTIVTQTGSVSYETEEIQQFETSLYETLIATESPQFIEYITTSINPQTETIIEEKLEQNIVLTPFEETFYNCDISLEERQEIVLDVLERLASGEIDGLENITYSNPKFGDCIIPFPDINHRETVQENSFESNKLIAKTIQGIQTKYKTHESIEKIMGQEKKYQESMIHHEIEFSELLKHGVINGEEHKIFLEELRKVGELQEYYLSLFMSGEISQEEYEAYTLKGQEYLEKKQEIIERYKNKSISETAYRKEIAQMQQDFEENYILLSESFGDNDNKKPGRYIGYIYSILSLFVISILGCGIFVLIKRYKK